MFGFTFCESNMVAARSCEFSEVHQLAVWARELGLNFEDTNLAQEWKEESELYADLAMQDNDNYHLT